MATNRRQLEQELIQYSQRLHAEGWVANHDGNITARMPDGRMVATPTGISKGSLGHSNIIVLDDAGAVVSGRGKAFSELALHLYIYRQRPDAMAVIHSHAPHATALAVAGVAVEPRMLAEPVVSLGASIPLVPYAAPKTPEWTLNLQPHVLDADAITLENHGVLTWGPDLETAYMRMELVEHLARIQVLAASAGAVRTVPEADVGALLESRKKAGLGAQGRQPVPRQAPASTDKNVSNVVRQEVRQAVRRR